MLDAAVPVRPIFLAALAVWMGAFLLITRLGTWAPLAVAGPLLAALVLVREPAARELMRPRASLLLLGLAGAAAMTTATYLLFALLSRLVPDLRLLTIGLYNELRAPGFTPLERAALIPLVAAAEEVVFRGIALPDRGAPAARAVRAVALNSIIVGAAHLASGNWLLALVAALCGGAWGGLRVWTRSCVPSVVTHVVWDLAILVFWPLI